MDLSQILGSMNGFKGIFILVYMLACLPSQKNKQTSQKIQVWYYRDSLIRRETIGWVWNIRGYFEHFQSCVTVVKMQPHWWFLVCILLEHCTLTKKWNFGLNCLQNDQFTPFTYHYLVKYGFLMFDNPKSIINISKKWIFPRYPELGLCLLDVT